MSFQRSASIPASSRISASREPEDTEFDSPPSYVGRLLQAWINERAAPELLQYEGDSVSGLLTKIDDQLGVIDELDAGDDTSVIVSILYQTELERIKFLLRSYLRTRISKIEKYSQHILSDPGSRRKLSRAEISYAESYSRAVQQHCHSSFLSSLPLSLQGQDDKIFERKLSMVSEPRLDEAVFCRVLESIGGFQLDENDAVDLVPGQIYLVQYSKVRPLLQHRQIELI